MPVFLNYIIALHFLVVTAFLISLSVRFLTRQHKLGLTARDELRFNFLLLAAILLAPLIIHNIANDKLKFEPFVKTYSASRVNERSENLSVQVVPVALGQSKAAVSVEQAEGMFLYLFLMASLVMLVRILQEWISLRKIIKKSFVIRTLGNVKIVASDHVAIPLSFLFYKTAWIILPTSILASAKHSRVSILHEMQHHRQKDTVFVYFQFLLKIVFALNPAFYLWMKTVSELQELKVDEYLVHQKNVKPQEYACCLASIVENVVEGRIEKLSCAAGFSFVTDRHILLRRIQNMFEKKQTQRRVIIPILVSALLVVSAVALAASQSIGMRALTMNQALKLAESSNKDAEFPVVMNDMVFVQLNKYVGTTQGRDNIKNALVRMKTYESLVLSKLNEYGVPKELQAMPLIESGYQNLAPKVRARSAGVWQFIEQTATNYGLDVTDEVDDRMNVEEETDAAMRLLMANKLRFKDWSLSIMAYNAGEDVVRRGIAKTKSKDVWTLIRNNYQGDQGYMAKLMAAIIVMKNPSLLN